MWVASFNHSSRGNNMNIRVQNINEMTKSGFVLSVSPLSFTIYGIFRADFLGNQFGFLSHMTLLLSDTGTLLKRLYLLKVLYWYSPRNLGTNKNIQNIITLWHNHITLRVPTFLLGLEFHGHHIGASVGLTHGQCSHVLSRHQLRHNTPQSGWRKTNIVRAFSVCSQPSAGISPSVSRCRGAPSDWHRGLSGHRNWGRWQLTPGTSPPSRSHGPGSPVQCPRTPLDTPTMGNVCSY